MLYIVLILVLAALAGVVTALITANSLWAWISIGLSVFAGIVLFVDWMRRRSAAHSATEEPSTAEQAVAEQDKDEKTAKADDAKTDDAKADAAEDAGRAESDVDTADTADTVADDAEATPGTEPVEAGTKDAMSTAMLPAAGELDDDRPVVVDDAVEETAAAEPRARTEATPGEEETDAADLLIVSELDAEVVVVDEYPRYHLADCGWLADRDTIPIEIAEARELGFTPCARCGPDASLAAAHRRRGKSRADR